MQIRTWILILLIAACSTAGAAEIPVFIFAGQSNAVGASAGVSELPLGSPYLSPQSNVLFFGPNHETPNASATWSALQAPTETLQAVTGPVGTQGFGPEISAGQAISNNLLGGATVAEVKFAINGSSLFNDWNPANPGQLYDQMIARVNAAMTSPSFPAGNTPKLAGFFWMQGESDVSTVTNANAYESNLTSFISTLRADLGTPDLPFVMGQINNAGGYQATVRQALVNVGQNVPNARLAETDDLQRSILAGDSIHFNTQGIVDLGIRFAQTYDEILAGDPPANSSVGTMLVGTPTGAVRTDAMAQAGFGFSTTSTGTKEVNRLGYWDAGGDGLAVDHTVVLYNHNAAPNPNNDFTVVAKATVPAGTSAMLDGGYRWVTVPTFALTDTRGPGDYYILMASAGTDPWIEAFPTAPGILSPADMMYNAILADRFTSTVAIPGSVGSQVNYLIFNGLGTPAGYGGPNLGFLAAPVPEPASLSLAAIAGLSLTFITRRRQR